MAASERKPTDPRHTPCCLRCVASRIKGSNFGSFPVSLITPSEITFSKPINLFLAFSSDSAVFKQRKSTTMTMLDMRLILVVCCSLQLGRLAYLPFPPMCPPEFPHQLGMSACYSINEEYLTFDEAVASCIAKGGKLGEPRTHAEETFMSGIVGRADEYHWFGITGTAVPGVWTYPSDNSPLVYLYRFESSHPPHGNYCITQKWDLAKLGWYHSTPCEQKARSVCQYDLPQHVCGLREGGELLPFNGSYTMQYVRMPCDYTLASIVCGDYDVRVYGTSGPDKSMTAFTPISARVVVRRAQTNETLVSAQVSRDAIAKSSDGKNLWTVTAGAWSTEVSENFELARQAAVVKFGDVGQVDFSAIKDKVENGLYVRCKDLRSSAEFPESLCDAIGGTGNWSQALSQTSRHEGKIQLFMRAIAYQNAGQQLQCSDIARKVRSCPNEYAAVGACSAIFLYADLTKCLEADKLWFGICLDAHCNKDKDKCQQLKTKVAECGFNFPRRTPRLMRPFMYLLDTC